MPYRLALLCLISIFLVGGAARSAPAPARWHSVLAAGDFAEPVFDNAVYTLRDWLVARGVRRADIHRLSAGRAMSDPAVEPATARQLLLRIAQLPVRPRDRCLIFLTSHGQQNAGLWLAYSRETLSPVSLAQALSQGCGSVPTVVILSGCYSGIFARGPMLAPNRIIMTAARPDRPSFGCQADRTYTFFDECLLSVMPHSRLWRGLFDATAACVRGKEQQLQAVPSEPQAFFGAAVRDLPLP